MRGVRECGEIVRQAQVASVVVEKVEFEEVEEVQEEDAAVDTKHDFRLAWLWIEGWRGRLRTAGDIVEKTRHEFSDGKVKSLYVHL